MKEPRSKFQLREWLRRRHDDRRRKQEIGEVLRHLEAGLQEASRRREFAVPGARHDR